MCSIGDQDLVFLAASRVRDNHGVPRRFWSTRGHKDAYVVNGWQFPTCWFHREYFPVLIHLGTT